MTIHHLHFILRPDANGTWYVQDDADHACCGVDKNMGVVHEADHLRVYFSPVYAKAGTIQISTDDDFAGSVSANGALGLQCVSIKLRVAPNTRGIDPPINPKKIWDHIRALEGYRPSTGGGNLWVNITMMS